MKKLNLEFDSEIANTLVKCKQCGKCCNGDLFEIALIAPKDIKKIEKRFNKKINEIFTSDEITDVLHCGKYFSAIKQPCKFYINKVCTIYEDRPLVCRQFPIFYFNGGIRVDEARCLAGKELYEGKKNEYEETIRENFGSV